MLAINVTVHDQYIYVIYFQEGYRACSLYLYCKKELIIALTFTDYQDLQYVLLKKKNVIIVLIFIIRIIYFNRFFHFFTQVLSNLSGSMIVNYIISFEKKEFV